MSLTAPFMNSPSPAETSVPLPVEKDLRTLLAEGERGYVHSIETMGTLDGPGLRYVLFLSGCPLRCQYCHNPDAVRKQDGTLYDADEILADIEKYEGFIKRSRGGVTISGGEPLMQPAFTERILTGCKERGLHTAVDTSGSLGWNATENLLHQTDLVLLDIKSGLPDTYRKVTGGTLQSTLDFASRLESRRNRIWVRFVLVPGLTDAVENVDAVARIAASLSNVDRVEVLPFHKMGEYKWTKLGRSYQLANTAPPTDQEVETVRNRFRDAGCVKVY